MTSRQVAKEFCDRDTSDQWVFERGMTVSIDYVEEIGATTSQEFDFEDVIGVHEELDLALLKVSRESAGESESPKPLTLASEAPANIESRKVYVVGYPDWDGRRDDPLIIQRIFADIYGVKRLQPGEVRTVFDERSIFHHDCSTLGGNSGSCVIDIETNKVIGLHSGGLFYEANQAVALWKLTGDPLLKKARVHF
jgi:S1-C subfamily serine protease